MAEPAPLDIRGFVERVLELMHEGTDVDGADLQDAAVKHGLFVERPLTAEEATLPEPSEYDCREGDTWLWHSDALKAFLENR